MRLEYISMLLLVGWAFAAPAQNLALAKKQSVGVNGCWCCEIALQPNGKFYGAGTGCKVATSMRPSNPSLGSLSNVSCSCMQSIAQALLHGGSCKLLLYSLSIY